MVELSDLVRGEYCSDCKRPYATVQPSYELGRDPAYCYQKLQGRSRRAERSCAGHTIRRLQKLVRELEEWQINVRLTYKVDGVQLVPIPLPPRINCV